MTTQGAPRRVGGLLAGGQSSRMGRPKAGILLGDSPLSARPLAALRGVCEEVFVLGHGEGVEPSLPRLPDIASAMGPLGGVLALLRSGAGEVYVVAPCDMPWLTPELLRRLFQGSGLPTCFEEEGGHLQPLPAALPASALPSLERWVAGGGRSLRAWLESQPHTRVPLGEREGGGLADVDDPAALERAREREGTATTWRVTPRLKVGGALVSSPPDTVAVEEPLEIRIAGTPVAVVMRTPGHDEELACGFLRSEGVVSSASDIHAVRHCTQVDTEEARDNVLQVHLRPGTPIDWPHLKRSVYSSSSCGVCGKASLSAALRCAPALDDPARMSAAALLTLPEVLRGGQPLFDQTGGVHGVGLFTAGGRLLVVREDVGRHNAVDKVLGWALLHPGGEPPAALMVSGRVSFEIVQKALAGRIPIVAAVSAPTSLAVELASRAGITLVAFLRGGHYSIYSHPERIGLE